MSGLVSKGNTLIDLNPANVIYGLNPETRSSTTRKNIRNSTQRGRVFHLQGHLASISDRNRFQDEKDITVLEPCLTGMRV
jgi:hypothetical protein